MSRWRKVVAGLLPPLLLEFLRRRSFRSIRYIGVFHDWPSALSASSGYSSEVIFKKTCQAALKVVRGEAAYERDSVTFDKVEFSFPVIASLLRCACANDGRLRVLDFGGSLGTSYRQFKAFKPTLRELRWGIVEQPKLAAWGRDNLQNHELHFHAELAAAFADTRPDVVLMSGVLQYLERPYELIDAVSAFAPKCIVIDRTSCATMDDDVLTVQVVPPSIYDASYPCWIFSKSNLLNAFRANYGVVLSFADAGRTLVGPVGQFHEEGFVLEIHT